MPKDRQEYRSHAEGIYVQAISQLIPTIVYEPCRFPWRDVETHHYTPDVYLGQHVDGRPVYLELKGKPTVQEIKKLRNVIMCNPHAHFWCLLYVNKKANLRQRWSDVYADYGIPCFVGVIPPKWLQYIGVHGQMVQPRITYN